MHFLIESPYYYRICPDLRCDPIEVLAHELLERALPQAVADDKNVNSLVVIDRQ